jgi:hypothetical protein
MEPGQPWLMTRGSAFSWGERAWTKWIPQPSIPVLNWGSSLRSASRARQSYFSAQYAQTSWT